MQKITQQEVWNKISRKWKEFRVKPVKEAIDFIKNKKGKILDLGCGSGRNFAKIKGIIYGIDFSEKQLAHAREYAKKEKIKAVLIKARVEKLTFKNNFFDAAIFIAALHCIESKEKRKKALRELYRILKPEADALITVWDKDQPKFKKSKKEIMLPWITDGKKYLRYYYLYDREELVQLVATAGFKVIKVLNKDTKEGITSKRNIVIYVKKA